MLITDHAKVRYCERFLGMDWDGLYELSNVKPISDVVSSKKDRGSTKLKMKDYTLVVANDNGLVLTIYKHDGHNHN